LLLEQLEDRSLPSAGQLFLVTHPHGLPRPANNDLTGKALPIHAREGVPLQAVSLATFHDPVSHGQPDPASHFKVTIDWGDGTPASPGLVKKLNTRGNYAVLASHTFPEDTVTPYPVTILVNEGPEGSELSARLMLNTRATVAESPFGDNDLTGKALPVQAKEGVPFRVIPVATFHDPVSHGGKPDPVTEYKTTINWGDGSPVSVGLVKLLSTRGDYAVLGSHTNAEDSVTPYPVTVTITDPSEDPRIPPAKLVLRTTATVAESPFGDNDLTGKALPVRAKEGLPFRVIPVATFHDPVSHGGKPDPVSEFTATISWGDGSSNLGLVKLLSTRGDYAVLGSHTYAEDSVTPYPVTVTITDPSEDPRIPPAKLVLRTTATVAESPFGDNDLTARPVAVQGEEAVPLKAVRVATFHDPVSHGGPPDPVSEFPVTINWGDGSTSSGTVNSLGGGNYEVVGDHTYAEDGNYPVTVTISDAGSPDVVVTPTASIADGPNGDNDLTGTATPVQATAGTVVLTQVAAFNDPISFHGQPDPTSEYQVLIDWGDGTQPSSGQVQLTSPNGDYAVLGSHTYAQPSATAPYKITVTIIDQPDDTTQPPATLTLTTTATVTQPLG
jgi:hypothetical protein